MLKVLCEQLFEKPYHWSHAANLYVKLRNITAKQIQSNERLQHANNISYRQALRVVSTSWSA